MNEQQEHTVEIEGLLFCAECVARFGAERIGSRKFEVYSSVGPELATVDVVLTRKLRIVIASEARASVWKTSDNIRISGTSTEVGGCRHLLARNDSRSRGVFYRTLCEMPEGSFEISGTPLAEQRSRKATREAEAEARQKVLKQAEEARMAQEEAEKLEARREFDIAYERLATMLRCDVPGAVHPNGKHAIFDTEAVEELAAIIEGHGNRSA